MDFSPVPDRPSVPFSVTEVPDRPAFPVRGEGGTFLNIQTPCSGNGGRLVQDGISGGLECSPAAISREPPSSSSDRVAVTVPPITVRAIASAEAEAKASVPMLLTLPFRTSVPSLAITALDVLTLPFNTSVFSPVLTKSAPFPFTIRFPLKTESSKSLASSIFRNLLRRHSLPGCQ